MEPRPGRAASDADLARPPHVPAWLVWAALALIVVALVALLAVPASMAARTQAERRVLNETFDPAREAVADFQRAVAAEEAAFRGWVASEDTTLLRTFRRTFPLSEGALLRLGRLAPRAGSGLAASVVSLEESRARWVGVVDSVFRRQLPRWRYAQQLQDHQARFEAILDTARGIERRLAAEAASREDGLEGDARRQTAVTVALALLALAAALAAGFLAARLGTLAETLEERVEERTAEVRRLASDLTLAEQRERRELASALHDDLQQQLYGLSLKLWGIGQRITKEAPAFGPDLVAATGVVQEAVETTRRMTVDLSPPVLEGEGIAEAVEWLASQVRARFGLDVRVEVGPGLPGVHEDMRVLLFQIIRELLFNAVKHARTDRATVALARRDGFLVVYVQDEGAGFDPVAVGAARRSTGGFGLTRARERLRLFGGHLELASEPGRGTRATIAVPIEHLAHP